MINLEVFGRSTAMASVARLLDAADGVSRVRTAHAERVDHSIVSATVRPRAVDDNVILIVGAMAVSPDLLPITAVGVGLVGRRPLLAGRALLTLTLGLGIASAAAAVFAWAQDQLDLIPSSFDLQETGVLGGLTSVSDETIVVALAAGVAGMLALETRASSSVGVAISVTTIPAAAYLGVAIGLGELGEGAGAVAVLGTNVLMMVGGAVAALGVQSLLLSRAGTRRRRALQ